MYINDKVLKTILTDFRQRVESKDEAIKNLIKDTVSISVVEALPETGTEGTLYVVGTDSTGYTMSVYSNSKFISVSTTGSSTTKDEVVVASTLPGTIVSDTLYVIGSKEAGYTIYVGVSGEAVAISTSAGSSFEYEVVESLPETGVEGKLYLVGTESTGYVVAMYNNSAWVQTTPVESSLSDQEVQTFISELWA